MLFFYEAPRSRVARYQAEFFRSLIPPFARLRRASEGLFSSPSSTQQAAGYSAKENKKRILVFITVFIFLLGSVYFVQYVRHPIATFLMDKGGGYLYGLAYNPAKAERYFWWALQFDPEIRYGNLELAKAFAIQKKFEDALEAVNREIAHDSRFHTAYYVRGLIYGFGGQPEKAEHDFRKAVEIGPQNSTKWASYNDLAWTQFVQGKYEEVEKTSREGLRVYPDNTWLLNSLGLALFNLGKKEEARHFLDRALSEAKKLTREEVTRAYPFLDPNYADTRKFGLISTIQFNLNLASVAKAAESPTTP